MKYLVGNLPHHVPIRKENRWDPIQHYAMAPNTAVAAIPIRRPAIPELQKPERQASISSYISQYSSQNRQRLSNRSMTSSSREEDDRITVPSILSSPCSQNSRYSSKQHISSSSLFSTPSLATPGCEGTHPDVSTNMYPDLSITNDDSNFISKLEDWFEHSDDSSASQEETNIARPSSGRSMMPIVHEYNKPTDSKAPSDNQAESESGSISEMSELSQKKGKINSSTHASKKNIIIEDCVKKVLHESAPHSFTASSDETVGSDTTGSTKLDRLREKMKRLREKNHRQILQSRSQLQRTQTFSQAKSAPSPHQTEPFSYSIDASKSIPITKERRHDQPLHRTDTITQSISTSNEILMSTEKDQGPSLHSTQAVLPSPNNSSPTRKEIEQQCTESHQNGDVSISSESDESSLDSQSSFTRSSIIEEEIDSRQFEDDYDPAFDPDIDINSSFDSSKQNSSAHEVDENDLEEDLYINSSFDSSKCSSIAEQAVQSLREERVHINSSFDSSKCSTIAEEAVQSLRSERLNLVSSFDSAKCASNAEEALEGRAESQYEPSSHITRHYSLSKSKNNPRKTSSKAPDFASSSSPTRSPLQQKLERRGRRPRSTKAPLVQRKMTVQENTPNGMSPQAANLARELQEALASRGPPIEAQEGRKRSWCDPFQSDGILPLASEDSLSLAYRKPPKTFRDKRNAYLSRIGDFDERRRQSPFTANRVLGKFPEKPPILESQSEVNNVQNLGSFSPARKVKGWMPPRKSQTDGDPENNGRHTRSRWAKPIREIDKSDLKHQNWAQCSFVNEIASSSTNKEHFDINMVCTGKLEQKKPSGETIEEAIDTSSKRLEGNSSQTSFCRGENEPSSSNMAKEEQDSTPNESSVRTLVRRKSSKEIEKAKEKKREKEKESEEGARKSFSKRSVRRIAKQSALDQSGERNSSKLSQQLLGTSSKSLAKIEREGAHRRSSSKRIDRSNSKSSIERARRSPRRRLSRKNSKSSVDQGRDGSFKSERSSRKTLRSPSIRKPLRSPSKSPKDSRDRSCKLHGAMDRTTRASNATSKSQETSSWRKAKKRNSGTKDEKNIKKPSSGRFVSVMFGKLSRKKDEKMPKTNSSGRLGSIPSKSSSDKGDDKRSPPRKVSYLLLKDSSDEDDWEETTSRNLGSSSRFKASRSQGSHTQNPSARKEIDHMSFEKRDDSSRSISESGKAKRPSSWRESEARSVGRSYSHMSNTATTVSSDPSSNDSNTSHGNSSYPEEEVVEIVKNDDLDTPKHERRTRPRRNTSHRSALRRFRRYKDYRKNGVLVGEHKRFHVDMAGGIQ